MNSGKNLFPDKPVRWLVLGMFLSAVALVSHWFAQEWPGDGSLGDALFASAPPRSQVIVRPCNFNAAGTLLSEEDFKACAAALWEERTRAPRQKLQKAGLVVYLNASAEDYLVFDAYQKELAQLSVGGTKEYYTVPPALFKALTDLSLSAREKVPAQVLYALTLGKPTGRTSVNDMPYEVYCAIRIGNTSLCLYERDGEYFLEIPYTVIKRLTKEQYLRALPYCASNRPQAR